MPELMTKQDAIKYLLYMKHDVQAKSPMDIALDTAIESLKQPTIEPEVRHGRWICCGTNLAYDYSYIRCSHCNHEIKKYNYSTETFPKYCEECGYRMDGGDGNG